MFSTLVDVPLFLALVGTTVCTAMLYRRLKQLDAGLEGYRRMIAESAGALDAAGQAAKGCRWRAARRSTPSPTGSTRRSRC